MNFTLPPAALPGAKLLKKFDQNFLLPFGQLPYSNLRCDPTPVTSRLKLELMRKSLKG
jgi:hypothetical protein